VYRNQAIIETIDRWRSFRPFWGESRPVYGGDSRDSGASIADITMAWASPVDVEVLRLVGQPQLWQQVETVANSCGQYDKRIWRGAVGDCVIGTKDRLESGVGMHLPHSARMGELAGDSAVSAAQFTEPYRDCRRASYVGQATLACSY